MYDVLEIAKWIIKYNNYKNETEGEDLITNLKLQKLLYYAQSMSLAFNNIKLFDDKFEAWQHGPVLPIVYNEYKSNKSNEIIYTGDIVELDDKTKEILITTYDYFGKHSAWGLRNLTHTERPWMNAYKLSQTTQSNVLIDENEMKEQFIDKYVK